MSDLVITDRRKAFDRAIGSILDAEELEGLIGVLSGKPRYPERRGGTAVAKVGAVLEAKTGFFSMAIDVHQAAIDRMLGEMFGALLKGGDPKKELRKITKEIQEFVRDQIMRHGLFKEGTLHDTIKQSVRKGRGR